MRKLLLAIVAVTVGFTSCKKKENPAPTTASVMFVNGCAGTTGVDVAVNSVSQGGNLAFLKNWGYKQITAGTSTSINFTLTNLGTPLTSSTESLAVGAHYSAFAAGLITGTSLVFTTDDLTAPAAGMAKVRFVNLSSDTLSTSCYIGATKLFSDITYKSCTPFKEVAAASGVKVAMVDQTVLTSSGDLTGQNLAAGKIYTFMLTGTAKGTSSSVLTLTMIGNN